MEARKWLIVANWKKPSSHDPRVIFSRIRRSESAPDKSMIGMISGSTRVSFGVVFPAGGWKIGKLQRAKQLLWMVGTCWTASKRPIILAIIHNTVDHLIGTANWTKVTPSQPLRDTFFMKLMPMWTRNHNHTRWYFTLNFFYLSKT